MDAALALFNAVLPGWFWFRTENGLMGVFSPDRKTMFVARIDDSKDARALLLATLKALQSQPEEKE